MSERKNKAKIAYRQSIGIDENGEIIYDVLKKNCWQNGSGFVISYSDKICNLIENVPTGSVLRVFFYIAHNQQYGDDDAHFGYACTRKFLQEKLNLKQQKSVFSALKWLKDNFLINETKVNGVPEFMVNPDYVTIGTKKKKREIEWNRRCQAYIKKLESKSA